MNVKNRPLPLFSSPPFFPSPLFPLIGQGTGAFARRCEINFPFFFFFFSLLLLFSPLDGSCRGAVNAFLSYCPTPGCPRLSPPFSFSFLPDHKRYWVQAIPLEAPLPIPFFPPSLPLLSVLGSAGSLNPFRKQSGCCREAVFPPSFLPPLPFLSFSFFFYERSRTRRCMGHFGPPRRPPLFLFFLLFFFFFFFFFLPGKGAVSLTYSTPYC